MNTFWQRLFGWVKPTHPPTAANKPRFADMLVDVANDLDKERIRETSKNHGPGIERLWAATSYGTAGYRNREPWCAAAIAWVVKTASQKYFGESPPFRLPRSAAVNDWPTWAEIQPTWRRINPAKSKVQAGDIVCWDFNGRDQGGGTHIGLAMSDERPDGTYDTAEGNTNAAGSREGNGFYIKSSRTRAKAFSILRYTG